MSNDITELLYRIKENIHEIESGDARTSLLDEVQADFLELIELIKLFLISERDSYYGYFLMNMQFAANFYSNSIAGIKLNVFPPLFEANPLLLCKFTLKEIIYVLCHEIDHVVLNHPAEMVKANPDGDPQTFYEFNLAADASVNDRLNHEINTEHHQFMSMPEGGITSAALSRMFSLKDLKAMETYAYYFKLIRNNGELPSSGVPQNGQQSMMSRKNMKDETIAIPDDRNIVTAANCGEVLSDHDWKAGDDSEDATAVVRELVNAAVGMMSDESRGLMPRHFMHQVKKLNKPPVLAWQSILKKYVGTITASKRRTRMRLNRRQPERFDLSGSVDDKVLKIVVAIDTSASVNDRMIAQIFNEIFAILAKRKHDITVIECDAEIQRIYRVRTPADIKTKIVGRGGTSFSPVIEYINKEKYYRDALLIYFTDGYGEQDIPRPRTYRNMWVVFGAAGNLSLKEPYGAVLSL